MKKKILLLKVSFILILAVAVLHTFFILIGGPEFPDTTEFLQMRELMQTIQFDTGGNVMRSMQDVMDGFNFIVSIFLFSLPILSWVILTEVKDSLRIINKIAVINLIAFFAFFITSMTLLAIGGTVIGGLVCLLLISSLVLR